MIVRHLSRAQSPTTLRIAIVPVDVVTLFTAHDKGISFVMIAPSGEYVSSAATAGFLVLKDSPIMRPRDLVGKTIGLSSLHNLGEVEIRTWMAASGLKSDDIKLLEVPFPAMGAALTAGRVDAISAQEPLISTMADHTRVVVWAADSIGRRFLEAAYYVTADYAKRNPAVVKRFADAMAEADAWANGHHDESFVILSKYVRGSLPKTMVRAYFPERLRVADLQPVIDATARVGLIGKAFPAREMLAPGIAG